MNAIPYQLLSICLLTLLLSCRESSSSYLENKPDYSITVEADTKTAPNTPDFPRDSSMSSLDWVGTYTATLPCPSCEGIQTWVTLNPDRTFELKTSYLGLNDARDETFTGKFTWNESGSRITLHGLIGGYPSMYSIEKGQIWQLDWDGNKIKGKLAEQYKLKMK
jgi:uncharacterized lipoprotein NlpE involved in copper resistance